MRVLADEKLHGDMSAEAERSLEWLRDYDIGGAWDEVFARIGASKEPGAADASEFGMVERLLLEGLEEFKRG